MKTQKAITTAFIAAITTIVFGCTKFETSIPTTTTQTQNFFDYAVYEGPKNISDFDEKYHNQCTTHLCLLEESPTNIPMKRHNGTPICITSKYESRALLAAHFNRDGNFIGASCQISQSDYNSISSHYGIDKVYNKYLNQRGVFEDFLNWKTSHGFTTTYKELIGRGKDGEIVYIYNLYIGNNEHPHYSEYVKP